MRTPITELTREQWRWLKERERAVPCCMCSETTYNNGAVCDRHREDQ